jgi:hypothetical protein
VFKNIKADQIALTFYKIAKGGDLKENIAQMLRNHSLRDSFSVLVHALKLSFLHFPVCSQVNP